MNKKLKIFIFLPFIILSCNSNDDNYHKKTEKDFYYVHNASITPDLNTYSKKYLYVYSDHDSCTPSYVNYKTKEIDEEIQSYCQDLTHYFLNAKKYDLEADNLDGFCSLHYKYRFIFEGDSKFNYFIAMSLDYALMLSSVYISHDKEVAIKKDGKLYIRPIIYKESIDDDTIEKMSNLINYVDTYIAEEETFTVPY